LESLFDSELRHNADDLVKHAVRANIRAAVNQLRHGSQFLEGLIQNGELVIVGAEYSLDTGVVEFIEGMQVTG